MENDTDKLIDQTHKLVNSFHSVADGENEIVVLNAAINFTVQIMKDFNMDPRVCIMAFSKTLAMYMPLENNEMIKQLNNTEMN